MISKKQINLYKKNGYIVLKNFLKKSEKKEFSENLFNVYSKVLKKNINHKTIHKIISIYEKEKKYDELYTAFKMFSNNKMYVKISRNLSNLAKKIHINKKFKIVNTGMAIGIKNSTRTAYKWHQEKPYYNKLETIHFQFSAFGICNKKNGTMSVLKGSHKHGFQKKTNNIKKHNKAINSFVPKNINILKRKFDEKSVNLNVQDIVVFNQYLIHRTNKNLTNKIRFAANIRLKILD